jgi:transposase
VATSAKLCQLSTGTTPRLDLTKSVFAIRGVDAHGKAVLVRPSVQRSRLHQIVAAPCTIGMEARSGAHHWLGRKIAR